MAALIIGSLLGGLVLGGVLAAVGMSIASLPEVQLGILWALSAITLAALLRPALMNWLPQRQCQVGGSKLRALGKVRAAATWGFELALGYRTFLVTPLFFVMVGTMIVAGPGAIAAGLAYGGSRGTTIATAAIVVARRARHQYDPSEPLLGMEARTRIAALPLTLIAAILVTMAI